MAEAEHAGDPFNNVPPKLLGKTVAFTGALAALERAEAAEHVRAEGGRFAEDVTPDVDYLVVGETKGAGPSASQKKAERLNQTGGARIVILGEKGFHELFRPTRDEALALLADWAAGRERWERLAFHRRRVDQIEWNGPPRPLDLRGAALAGKDLRGVDLDNVALDGADFSGADLTGARLIGPADCTFDGARMPKALLVKAAGCTFRGTDLGGATLENLERCDFEGARLSDARLNGTFSQCRFRNADLAGAGFMNAPDVSGCDFTGATLPRLDATTAAARGAVFRGAELTDARLENSHFERSDFQGADLGRTALFGCDLSHAVFRQSKLIGADLRGANLTGADLGESDLSDAILADADLSGASLDGADLRGASLDGARLDGLDLSTARNLTPEQLSPTAVIGPRMRELGGLAMGSALLETGAEADLDGGEWLRFRVYFRRTARSDYLSARYSHETPGMSHGEPVAAPTFEEGMRNLVKRWFRSRLRPGSVTVKASKCGLRGKALQKLAEAAWFEAFGIEPPAA